MTEETKQKKNERPTLKSGGTTRELVASTVAGLVSGAVASGDAIRQEFLEEVKMRSGLADFVLPEAEAKRFLDKGFNKLNRRGEHTRVAGDPVRLEGLVNRHARELTEANLKHLGQPTNWYKNGMEIRSIKSSYAKKIADFVLEEYGEHTSGWRGLLKGTFRQFPISLGDNTRNKVAFKGITFATIIGVGVYNLLTSIATRKKAREIEDLILDKVLAEPVVVTPTVEGQPHTAQPHTKVSHIASHDRLQAANATSTLRLSSPLSAGR